jgi:hypothetical protein
MHIILSFDDIDYSLGYRKSVVKYIANTNIKQTDTGDVYYNALVFNISLKLENNNGYLYEK